MASLKKTAVFSTALLLSMAGWAGGEPGAFLRAAMNARPLAMGNAHTAVADDASAPFWNASGLAQIQRYDVVTYFSTLGDNASIGSGAFAVPTARFGTFSVNYVSLQSGAFRRRDETNRDLGSFENNASALLLSHGFPFFGPLSAGYTAKAVRQNIERYSATGYGADVGFLYRSHPMWQVGLAFQNVIRPALKLQDVAEKLPTETRVGAKYDPVRRLTLAADASFLQQGPTELSLGAEFRVAGPLALRIGVNDREFSSGIGLALGDAGFDYSFGLPRGKVVRDVLGDTHRFSFHLRFGANVTTAVYREVAVRREEKRQEIVKQGTGVDQILVLRRRMPTWDGRLDPATFAQVQAARESLRQIAFTDPDRALEAQAYIQHFQGRFEESARLFDQLKREHPHSRRIRQHADIAHQRLREQTDPTAVASAYDDMNQRERDRRDEVLLAKAAALGLDGAQNTEAGGGGSAAEPVESQHGTVEAPATAPEPAENPQVAFLPSGMISPPAATLFPRPVAPPPLPAPVEAPSAPPVPAKPLKPEVVEAQKLYAEGNYIEAHLLTRRVLQEDPTNRAAARQAILNNAVLSAQADITKASQQVDVKEIERKVDLSLTLFDQGEHLRKDGKRDEALSNLNEAILLCPANFLARDMVNEIYVEIEDEEWRKKLGD